MILHTPGLIERFNFPDVVRGNLRQYVAVGSVNLGHGRGAFRGDANIGLVNVFVIHASRKVHDANAHARKRPGREVVAVPVAVANMPFPREFIQARAQPVG